MTTNTLLARVQDIAQQKQAEDEARRRLGLTIGQELGAVRRQRRLLTHCIVTYLGDFIIRVQGQRGTHSVEWTTTAVLIEEGMRERERCAA